MSLTYASARTELARRGFDYLSTAALGAYVQDAYLLDICEAENWPFLYTSTTGTAPLTVSDLRTIESVIDTTQALKLAPLEPSHVTDSIDTVLTTTGSPLFYWVSGETSSGVTISVYPANTTNTLSVRYWKTPTALSADGDVPALPGRFHSLIPDFAVARAYEDDDEWDAAQIARDRAESRLDVMRESLLARSSPDRPSQFIVQTEI